MNLYIAIEIISFLGLILFSLLCFSRIQISTDINRLVYLFNLFFLTVIAFFHYLFVLNYISNTLTLVTSLLLLMTFFIFFLLSITSYQFMRLRIIFIPFFFFLAFFRFFIGMSSINDNDSLILFENSFLILHIITSLLAYSLITISLATSFCSFIQDSYIRKMKYNKIIDDSLPSIYESELLAIRFLYLTIIFLIVSLISGLYYFIESGEELIYFFNEKVILSLTTLTITILIILIRRIRGLSGQMVFKMIFLSYIFISFSYFGIKLLG